MAVEVFLMSGEISELVPITSASAPDGVTAFEGLAYGNYVVRALPNYSISEQADYLPTYTNEVFAWPLAELLPVGCDQTTSATIELIALPNPGLFPGNAAGNVYFVTPGMAVEDTNRGMFEGDPIPGVPIILTKDTVAFQISFTGISGDYAFLNLPEGNYSIVVDIPGLPQVETHSFEVIQANAEFTQLNFYVDPESGIYITDINTVAEYGGPNAPMIYPNPAVTHLNFESDEVSVVTVCDLSGRMVLTHTAAIGFNTLSVAGLPAGMYVLHMADGRSARFVKL